MENKTPIEKWIEKNRKMHWVAYYTACHELLTYLGLQGIENPKEWVEKMKKYDKKLEWQKVLDKIDLDKMNFEGKCKMLKAEVTKLQNHINSLPTWADFNALKSERDSAQCNLADMGDENAKLQAELTEVKEKLKIAIDSAWESE